MNKKIMIAGEAVDASFLNELEAKAMALRNDPNLQPRPGSLDVEYFSSAGNIHETSDHFDRLLRHRLDVDTLPFVFPRKPGFMGGVLFRVRGFLWRLLRYQHDRMSSRQNRINAWLLSAMEQRAQNMQREVDGLRQRIQELEDQQRNRNASS